MRPECPRCGRLMAKGSKTAAGRQRWLCRSGTRSARVYCYSTTAAQINGVRNQRGGVAAPRKAPVFKRALTSSSRFIVTCAQNATPVNKPFLQSLLTACNHLNAELLVVPTRYKNPTSRWTASQANEEQWASEVTPYMYNARKKLNPNMVLLGDVKAQPTASSPLSGFEGLTGGESAILGHTKLQLRVIPSPATRFPKILTTTGAVTLPNYTDSRAGKLGEFHHVFGAALVEVKGKTFHLRQLLAGSDGSFTDLDKHYSASGVVKAVPALGVAFGDTHWRFQDPDIERATFGQGGIVETVDARTLIFHDVNDDYAVNPHHRGNPFIALAKRRAGFHLVRQEVEQTIAWMCKVVGKRKGIVVPSNHDDFLRRWVLTADWKEDVENADFYLETARAMLASTRMGSGGAQYDDPFTYWVNRLRTTENLRALKPDESFTLAGIEHGLHGHQGPNGARGSIKNLSRLGCRVVSGHGHTPGIEEGHVRVGKSTGKQEYEHGPSSHLNTHCVTYGTGKRTLITVIDGEWRL